MTALPEWSQAPMPSIPQVSQLHLPIRAETHQGLGELEGMLLFDGRELRLDFQTSDSLFGVLRSKPESVIVPLAAIQSVRCGLGFFWVMPYIALELNDFQLLARVPGANGGRWRLRVRYRDRQALLRMTDAVAFARAKWLHERLASDLPPLPPYGVPTPLSSTAEDTNPSEARRRIPE